MVQTEMTAVAKLTGLSKLEETPGGGVAAGIVQRSTPGGKEAIVRVGGERRKDGENKGSIQAPVACGGDLFQILCHARGLCLVQPSDLVGILDLQGRYSRRQGTRSPGIPRWGLAVHV